MHVIILSNQDLLLSYPDIQKKFFIILLDYFNKNLI